MVLRISLYCILLSALLLSSCSQRVRPVDLATEHQILLRGNGADPKTLDPHIATGLTEHNVISALFEGLVSADPKDLSPTPGMAKSWEISSDKRIFTFQLHQDLKWSDGAPLTAHDFVYSFNRLLSPKLGAEYASMLFILKNAKDYYDGKINNFNQVGARAPSDHTLIIELENPTPYFLSLLTHYSWFPVPKHVIEKHGATDLHINPWSRPNNIVSNGPFILKEWKINQHIYVEKNPRYWDQKTVKLNEIHFFPITKQDTEASAFKAGMLHITETMPLHRIQYHRENTPEKVQISPYLGTYYYIYNTKKKPFDDVRIRKALAYAINREDLTLYGSRGGEIPAYHFTPPETNTYTAPRQFKGNLEKAKELLAEAGYPNGEGLPKIQLLYNSSEGHKMIAEAIQGMWKENLNIKVQLYNQDWKVYLNSRKERDFQVCRAGWIGDYNDPVTFLELFTSYSGNNHTNWSSPKFDALLEKAGKAKSKKERFEYFNQMESMIAEEMPIIPLYFYVSKHLIHPSLKGWHPNVMDQHPYKYMYLEPVKEVKQ